MKTCGREKGAAWFETGKIFLRVVTLEDKEASYIAIIYRLEVGKRFMF